jgi:hypothetical protein
MRSTMPSLEQLTQRFAGLFEQAVSLYDKDQAFRDLCDAHAACVRGVRRSAASKTSTLGAGYAAQQTRLEAEMLRRLQTPGVPDRMTGRAGRPAPGKKVRVRATRGT